MKLSALVLTTVLAFSTATTVEANTPLFEGGISNIWQHKVRYRRSNHRNFRGFRHRNRHRVNHRNFRHHPRNRHPHVGRQNHRFSHPHSQHHGGQNHGINHPHAHHHGHHK